MCSSDLLVVELFHPRIDEADGGTAVNPHPFGDGICERQVGVAGDDLRRGRGWHGWQAPQGPHETGGM